MASTIDISTKSKPAPRNQGLWRRRLISMSIGVVSAFLIIELIAQAHTIFVLNPLFKKKRDAPGFYLEGRESQLLAYGLKRNLRYEHDELSVIINRDGIRDERDEFPADQHMVGILGDSAVFGFRMDQEDTISVRIEQHYKSEYNSNAESLKETSVLNLGVPGYDMMQIQAQLQWTDEQYDLDKVVYLLNLNDFCLRNTVREGGSGGAFRMYMPPLIKTPTYLRKLRYRIVKNGKLVNPDWYRWLYRGTREVGFDRIRAMSDSMYIQDKDFMVVILPAGCAYTTDGYSFEDIHSEIRQFLDSEGIPYLDPYEQFNGDDFDQSDHMHRDANKRMADLIWTLISTSAEDD